MRPFFLASAAFALFFPVATFAASTTSDPYLIINHVTYDKQSGNLHVEMCNTGFEDYQEHVLGTLTIVLTIDGKTDHYGFSGDISEGDCKDFTSVAAFSHFSGFGGIKAGTYELAVSIENSSADHSPTYLDVTLLNDVPPAAGMQPFSDVPSDFINFTAINYVKNQGIVDGYADGTYRPYNVINRAEFTKIVMLYKFGQQMIDMCGSAMGFSDVSFNDWFGRYICRGKDAGIIDGYSDKTFRPNASINFSEAAKIIARTDTFNAGDPVLPADNGGPWYEQYVRYLANDNAIPVSITSFDHSITRGEMAEMIYRLKTENTSKPSQSYESLNAPVTTSASFSLPQYGFTLGAATSKKCTWKDLGPNDTQLQLDAGEMTSGTLPAARKVVAFHCPAFSIPDFTLNVYEQINFDQEIKAFRGTCGTQFAEKNEINRSITPDGPGPRYVETIQTIIGGKKQQADYCFNTGNSTMITLRWEMKDYQQKIAYMETIADSVILEK